MQHEITYFLHIFETSSLQSGAILAGSSSSTQIRLLHGKIKGIFDVKNNYGRRR